MKTFRKGLSNLITCFFAKSSIIWLLSEALYMRLNSSVLRVHSWFWYHSGYWANIINAQRCKPWVDSDYRKSICVYGRPAAPFWSWNLVHGIRGGRQNKFEVFLLHWIFSVLLLLFCFEENQKIPSITVKSLFIWQTLICCSCFCKDQMGNGSCTAN